MNEYLTSIKNILATACRTKVNLFFYITDTQKLLIYSG